jgi:putative ABC transport system permease protein
MRISGRQARHKALIKCALAFGSVLMVPLWFSGPLPTVLAQKVTGGAQNDAARRNLPATGPACIEVRSIMPAAPPERGVELPARVTYVGLRSVELDRLMAAVPAIEKAVPIRESPMWVSGPGAMVNARVVRTTRDHAELRGLRMKRGRFLADSDDRYCRRFVVLGSEAAKTLFPSQDALGHAIDVGLVPFTVIGVVQQQTGGGRTQDSDSDIYIPVSTAIAQFGEWIRMTREERSLAFQLSRIVIVLRKDAKVQETIPLINSVLEPFHHRGAVQVVVVNREGQGR